MIGIVVIAFILGCEFYLSVAPFGEKGSATTFFANYLGAPLFFFDLIAYKVRLPTPYPVILSILMSSQLWCKTKMVKPEEVDFSEAFAFDEQDKLEAELAAQDGRFDEKGWGVWQKAKNLVFG